MNDCKSSDYKSSDCKSQHTLKLPQPIRYESPCEEIARTAYDNCLKETRMSVCPESFYLRVLADCTRDPRKYVKYPPGMLYD